MALIKVSQLPDAGALNGTEELLVVQSGASKKVALSTLAAEVEALGQHSQLVGDGTNVNINVTHGLNTRDVHVTVRRATSPYDQVMCDNECPSLDVVTLKFGAIAPATDSFRVVVSK